MVGGAGYRAISAMFREAGVEAVQGRGSSWSPQSIGDLIRNPTYKGVISYDGIVVPGRHPPTAAPGPDL